MGKRVLQLFVSVAGLALAWTGACTIADPSYPMGEIPLELMVHDDEAYLLTVFSTNGPHPRTQSRLSLTKIAKDGSVTKMHDAFVPAIYPSGMASVITYVTNGPVAFATAGGSSDGPYAVVVTQGASKLIQFGTGGAIPLSIIRRDSSRQWVFNSYYLGAPRSNHFPLYQIENGVPSLLAENVIWARCDESWCQQVRIENTIRDEDFRLSLYANPATSDLSPALVTETVDIPRAGYYPCSNSDGGPVLVVGHSVYSVSTTTPSFVFVGTDQDENLIGKCPLKQRAPYTRKLMATFANGGRIIVQNKEAVNPSPENCNAECRDSHHLDETWIYVYDRNNHRVKSFKLHDL